MFSSTFLLSSEKVDVLDLLDSHTLLCKGRKSMHHSLLCWFTVLSHSVCFIFWYFFYKKCKCSRKTAGWIKTASFLTFKPYLLREVIYLYMFKRYVVDDWMSYTYIFLYWCNHSNLMNLVNLEGTLATQRAPIGTVMIKHATCYMSSNLKAIRT